MKNFKEILREKLKNISLGYPPHIELKADGHGYFPDSYKLTDQGIEHILSTIEEEFELVKKSKEPVKNLNAEDVGK